MASWPEIRRERIEEGMDEAARIPGNPKRGTVTKISKRRLRQVMATVAEHKNWSRRPDAMDHASVSGRTN